MDLVERAREFAIGAHTRIDHRRKYTRQPYDEHLASVARLVASVTDDPEMVAAAWCHDVVEDTPATLYDVEHALGPAVAGLVDELTDISRPSDGNRKTRKAIDRRHLAAQVPSGWGDAGEHAARCGAQLVASTRLRRVASGVAPAKAAGATAPGGSVVAG